MSDKIKKFDAGGSILDQSNIAGQIFAQQPSGIGSAGTPLDLSSIQQSYASTFPMDLAYMDMLEDAADKEEFRMQGVTDAPTLEEAEEALVKAAGDLANWKSSKGTAYSPEETGEGQAGYAYFDEAAKRQNALEEARANFIALGGDPDSPNVGQKIINFIGATGQGFSDLITLGTGPEVAQTLLDPVSILLGGLGGTINYGQSGTTTPLIVGKTTKTGMPVGINIPDPRTIVEGGLGTLIPGAAAAAATAGALSVSGNQDPQDPSDGIGVTPAAVLTTAAAADDDDSDASKIGDPNGDSNSSGNNTVDSGGDPDALDVLTDSQPKFTPVDIATGSVDSDTPTIRAGARNIVGSSVDPDTPAIKAGARNIVGGTLSDDEIDRILAGGRPAVAGGYDDPSTTPSIKTGAAPAAGGGDGGGGGGTTALSGGTQTVSVEPGPLVDIPGFYDISSMSIIPDYIDELVERERQRRGAAEGGHVKRFNAGGATDAEKLASVTMGQATGFGPTSTNNNSSVRGKLSQFVGDNAGALLTSAVGGLFGLLDDDEQQPTGYQGAIPDYQYNRTLKEDAFSAVNPDGSARRPGSVGRSYFDYGAVPFTGTSVMQGVGLPAIAPAATTSTELDTEGLAAAAPVATLTDTLGQEGVANLLSNITGMFGGGEGEGAGVTPAVQPAAQTAVQPAALDAVDVLTDSTPADTTADTTANAFANFLAPFYNSELTPAQLIQLGDSGYDLAQIAGGLSVDENALTNAIAQARSAAQTQSILNSVDPSDGFSKEEQDSVANLILGGQTGVGNVAKQYGLDDMDVIAGLFKGGYEAPAEIIERLAANNPGLTEVQLMENLLAQGRATPEEIAAYYSDNAAYPQYAGITAADIRAYAKERGIEGFAAGGMAQGQGYYLGGPTDGMADLVPATIDGAQPAALSDGEFVVPADVVSHLGNGNSDAGAKQLYSMMDRVRTERTGTTKQGPEINPTKMMPA